MTMNSLFKKGTGLTVHTYDYEKKYVAVDFSGNDWEQCYRNDAAILFFAANSYREAYLIIEREIDLGFEKGEHLKHIEHLIMPYLFSFRHYLELELKAIYAATTDNFPKPGHFLTQIANDVGAELKRLEYKKMSSFSVITQKEFDEKKQDILSRFDIINQLVKEYCDFEPAVEYYRYIFGLLKKNMVLENPRVELDFNKMKNLFHDISCGLLSICRSLSDMNIYVYYIL